MLEKVPCGPVVSIWRFHRHGPGSIPGMGNPRLCPFYFIIKQVKKSRFTMLQYVIIFYNFRVQNFVPSADCITSTITVMQFCYRHQRSPDSPMGSSGQDVALSLPSLGFDSRLGKFTAILCDFHLHQKIREMVHLVYKSSIFVEFNAKNLVSSGAGNILTIILI